MKLKLPQDFRDHVLRRPGMYFGYQGVRCIPVMILQIADVILRKAGKYNGPLEVNLDDHQFSLTFHGLNDPFLSPLSFAEWIAHERFRPPMQKPPDSPDRFYRGCDILTVAQAADRFSIFEVKKGEITKIDIRNGILKTESSKNRGESRPLLRVTCSPEEGLFGSPGHEEIYRVAGGLRDLSLLRAGLITRLNVNARTLFQYCYDRGLESGLFEVDHQRWPIYTGVLRASGRRTGSKFECCVRFVHAGLPCVRTWVNHKPTQGGSHLKGLARALEEVFEEEAGCRTLPLVVNPDSMCTVMLPYSVIGALHAKVEEPRYYGPTKDVLMHEEIEEFIYQRSRTQFARQWKKMKKMRAF